MNIFISMDILRKTTWQFTYYDDILDACAKAFHLELNSKYLRQEQVQRLLRY